MKEEDLVEAYKTLIRPTAEYASPVWGPMITAKQSEYLERQQTQALRNIYGQAISAKKMRDKANLPLLSPRRRAACLSFATRNLSNPRCCDWFVERPEPKYARRAGMLYRKYEECTARTERIFNSPVNNMIRLLNA